MLFWPGALGACHVVDCVNQLDFGQKVRTPPYGNRAGAIAGYGCGHRGHGRRGGDGRAPWGRLSEVPIWRVT